MKESLILVVEDEPVTASALCEILLDLDYRVLGPAVGADQALALAAQERPDLMLSDILIEGPMDGIELARQMRRRWRVPVIFLTGHTDPEILRRATAAAPHGFLIKPLREPELVSGLETALYRARVERDLEQANRILERRVAERTRELELRNRQLADEAAEHRRAAERLRLVSEAVEQSPASVVITDTNGRIEYVNRRFTEVTGYTADEVRGKNPRLLQSGETPPATYREMWRIILAGGQWRGRLHNRRKDGSLYWEQAVIQGIRDPRSGVTHLLGVKEDVTERLEAERRLRRSESQLRAIFDNSQVGIMQLDGNGQLVRANQRLADILGYGHPGELCAAEEAALHLSDERLEDFRHGSTQALREGRALHIEFQLRRRDGSPVWCLLSGKALDAATPADLAQGAIWVVDDIGARKRAEEERARMERELRHARKLEALGQLTGGVAHEFNNMLAVVLGYAELASQRYGASVGGSLRGYLERILTAGGRARQLVQQMLVFSRGVDRQPVPLDLAAVTGEAVSLGRSMLPSSIDMVTEPSPRPLPQVLADPGEMHQVLLNLFVNARDAMEGKGRLQVALSYRPALMGECSACHGDLRGDWVEVSVADTGPGIPSAHLERIFDPFFTTKEVGKGTGLGLAVCQGIVERSGGHILVENRDGGGALFRLLLPPVVPDRAAPSGSPEAAPVPRVVLWGRALVVDDEPALAQFICEILGSAGMQVTARGRGGEALADLRGDPAGFDLLVTDQTMPGITGVELAAAAKRLRPDLPVLLCTGYSDAVDKAKALDLGIDAYLQKPVASTDLLTTVYGLLSARR